MRRWAWLLVLPCLAAAVVLLASLGGEEDRAPPAPLRVPTHDIHVEVLNGCGEDGIARALGNRLRALGFDVITVGNADSYSYPETLVIDRVGKLDYARQVADALGIRNTIQQIIPDPFRIEEVTVVVGGDHPRLDLAADGPETVTR